MDKEVSVDEDILAVPLEPIRTHTEPSIDNEKSLQDELFPPSILRRESSSSSQTLRKVSFPKEETELATYREPENDCPWTISKCLHCLQQIMVKSLKSVT